MGGNYRQPYNSELSPGPSHYNTNNPWSKGILMGKEKRLQHAGEKSLMPGPGAYTLPKNKGKGVYMGAKYPEKQLFNTPGPGTYQSDGKKDGPCYTIGGIGMKGKYETLSPGPAAYDLIHSYQQIYNAKPGKSFGKKNLI